MPARDAVSTVMGSRLARPRMPSVPNNCLMSIPAPPCLTRSSPLHRIGHIMDPEELHAAATPASAAAMLPPRRLAGLLLARDPADETLA